MERTGNGIAALCGGGSFQVSTNGWHAVGTWAISMFKRVPLLNIEYRACEIRRCLCCIEEAPLDAFRHFSQSGHALGSDAIIGYWLDGWPCPLGSYS